MTRQLDPNKANPDDARVSVAAIERAAARRSPGYVDAYRDAAYKATATHLYLSRDEQNRMVREWRPLMERIGGPGDVVARAASACGVNATPGCGCRSWRARFNRAGWRGFWRLIPEWVRHLAKNRASRSQRTG